MCLLIKTLLRFILGDKNLMLDIKDLALHYGQSQILFGLTLAVQIGEISCVLGPNGVGKTSLLRALSGLTRTSAGIYLLNGKDAIGLRPDVLAKRGVGYVPQGRDIFPLLTVRENLEVGFACLPKSEHSIPSDIFEMFPVLKKMLKRRGGDLSGGQQQQLAIARALITRPKMLLLDEPTEGIQPSIIKEIGDVLMHLKREGKMAIVLVEQFFDFAFELGDFFSVMERGVFTLQGESNSLSKEQLRNAVSI